MKELSIEEKAKRYDEAIEQLRAMMPNWENLSYNGKTFLQDLVYIFPELAESEDEKIRKEVINYFYDTHDDDEERAKFITYLEKQGGQNYKIIKGKNYFCVKTHNYAGVEWIKGTKYYASDNYTLVNQGCEFYCPEYSKEEHNIFFKEVEYDGCLEKQAEQKPAESGKEIKPNGGIVCEDFNDGDGYYKVNLAYLNKEQVEKIEALVSKWNQTDEDIKSCIGMCLTDADEQRFKDYNTNLKECLDWLKSLRPQNRWKPSTLQIEALESATENCAYSEYQDCLRELIKQLKKLKG